MNPQRLATKRLKPSFFRVQHDVEINGRKCDAVGNITILMEEKRMHVHVRRVMMEVAKQGDNVPLRDYMNGCIIAARKGTVMVSPFISPAEKEILSILINEELFVIYLVNNGFGEYYKPTDGIFNAVAKGRLLILSPCPYNKDMKHITREECVMLNNFAEEMATINR